jgi:hypothetical protein
MRYLPTILLVTALAVGEVHAWFDRYDRPDVNWIYAREVPMWLSWNIKYAEGQLQWMLVALAGYFTGRRFNNVNRAAWLMFTTYTILDTILYFYNYKGSGYSVVYLLCAMVFLTAIFFRRNEKGNNTRATG